MKTHRTNDAGALIEHLIGDDQELRKMVAEEHINVRVARLIYDIGHRPARRCRLQGPLTYDAAEDRNSPR